MEDNPYVPKVIGERERQLEACRRICHRRQRVDEVIREAGIRFLNGGSAGQYTKWIADPLQQLQGACSLWTVQSLDKFRTAIGRCG